jgi:streptogramin lyase
MRSAIGAQLVLAFLLGGSSASGVELLPGDVVVLESTNDSVVRVRPSSFVEGNPAANQVVITQGNLIANPYDVAIGDGVLFVTDKSNESIVRVDPDTGAQSLVPLDPSFQPRGIAIDSRGKLLVGDQRNFALLEIDPDTGAAATLTPGISLNTPNYVDLGPGDEIFIAESGWGLSRIDPGLQQATRVAGSLVSGKGLVVDPQTRDLYSSSSTEISRFDPDGYNPANPDGNREVVFADDATDVGLLPNGHLVATNAGNSDLLQIDPQTKVGMRVANGGHLLIPTGLAVVLPEPEPGAATGALTAGLAVCALARCRRHAIPHSS